MLKTNCYLLVFELLWEHPKDSKVPDYVYLSFWDSKLEEYHLSDIESVGDPTHWALDITKNLEEADWSISPTPHYFDNLEEAKEAYLIIKAYQPLFYVSSKCYIVSLITKKITIPERIIDVTEF